MWLRSRSGVRLFLLLLLAVCDSGVTAVGVWCALVEWWGAVDVCLVLEAWFFLDDVWGPGGWLLLEHSPPGCSPMVSLDAWLWL